MVRCHYQEDKGKGTSLFVVMRIASEMLVVLGYIRVLLVAQLAVERLKSAQHFGLSRGSLRHFLLLYKYSQSESRHNESQVENMKEPREFDAAPRSP
jgi:hypothetical protein